MTIGIMCNTPTITIVSPEDAMADGLPARRPYSPLARLDEVALADRILAIFCVVAEPIVIPKISIHPKGVLVS